MHAVTRVDLNENKVPFFANMSPEKEETSPTPQPETSAMSEEEEVELLVKEEMMKSKKMSNLRNAKG